MRRYRVWVLAGLAVLGSAGTALADCPTYRVRSGDTLRIIAEKFYGTREASGRIYRANARKIGPNPNLIEVGQVLHIPCDDGAEDPTPQPQQAAASDPVAPETPADPPSAASSAGVVAAGPEMTPEEGLGADAAVAEDVTNVAAHGTDAMAEDKAMTADAPVMDADADGHAEKMSDHMTDAEAEADAAMDGMALDDIPRLEMPKPSAQLYLLTGGPFPPFAGNDLPQGGMVTELVQVALQAAGGPAAEVVFVNDRAAHLEGIMPRGGFALAFPWTYPDCGQGELNSTARALCDDYRASEGFYEFVTEFYARADLPWAGLLVPQAMAGARICRPEGYPVDDLLALNLLPDKVELIRGIDAIDCLMMVDRAEADLASMDAAVTRALIDQITVQNPILVLEPLTRVQKLRVLAPRNDPHSAENIRLLNTGLRTMADDGRWFEIVSRHLNGQGS